MVLRCRRCFFQIRARLAAAAFAQSGRTDSGRYARRSEALQRGFAAFGQGCENRARRRPRTPLLSARSTLLQPKSTQTCLQGAAEVHQAQPALCHPAQRPPLAGRGAFGRCRRTQKDDCPPQTHGAVRQQQGLSRSGLFRFRQYLYATRRHGASHRRLRERACQKHARGHRERGAGAAPRRNILGSKAV